MLDQNIDYVGRCESSATIAFYEFMFVWVTGRALEQRRPEIDSLRLHVHVAQKAAVQHSMEMREQNDALQR